jgi:hypothetical protein
MVTPLTLAQRLVRGVPLVLLVSRGYPASAGPPTLEHAANLLAKRTWKSYRKWVRAHAKASDAIFAACNAVRGRGLAIAQEEIDAGARSDDDNRK